MIDGPAYEGRADAVLAGRYRLIEPVARGGMAEVWRGEDVRLSRPVAVKLIVAVRADRDNAAGGVWREARDSACLVHPNVVAVYDVGVDQGRLFIVMEWVAGRDLATVLRQHGPLAAPAVALVGAQTARALGAAHRAGIVHRDVKPANLLLTGSAVKLADFGIAVPADRDLGHGAAAGLETGPLMGTIAYVSPELAMGRPARPASDLYALGCSLYELLIGRPPFTGEGQARVLRLHLAQDPTPPSRLRPDVPARLERLILRLLTKDPAARPGDADQVAGTLESISDARHGVAALPVRGPDRRPDRRPDRQRPAPTGRMTQPAVSALEIPRRRLSRRGAAIAGTLVAALLAIVVSAIMATGSPGAHVRSPALAPPASGGPPTALTPSSKATPSPHRRPATAAPIPARLTKPTAEHGKGHHGTGPAKHDAGRGKGH